MNEKNSWYQRFGTVRGHGLFWGLVLAGAGGFWLVCNLELVDEPAKIVFPGLVILWGIANLFKQRAAQ